MNDDSRQGLIDDKDKEERDLLKGSNNLLNHLYWGSMGYSIGCLFLSSMGSDTWMMASSFSGLLFSFLCVYLKIQGYGVYKIDSIRSR